MGIAFGVSVTGEGCETLLNEIARFLSERFEIIEVTLSYTDGAEAAWFYEHGEVLERDDADDGIHLKVRLAPENIARYRAEAS
jgi:GTP-binding protein HflX